MRNLGTRLDQLERQRAASARGPVRIVSLSTVEARQLGIAQVVAGAEIVVAENLPGRCEPHVVKVLRGVSMTDI